MQITTQQAPTECSAQTDTFSATRLPKEIGEKSRSCKLQCKLSGPNDLPPLFLLKCLISCLQNIDNIAVCFLDEQWI